MYWIQYAFFVFFSIPIALLFERSSVGWLPSWLPMGFSIGLPTYGLVVLACAGRFADVASTVMALSEFMLGSNYVIEGAPYLRGRPANYKLFMLGLCQVAAIIIASTFLKEYYLEIVRLILIIVTLVSLAATFSNIIIGIGGQSVDRYRSMPDNLRIATYGPKNPFVSYEQETVWFCTEVGFIGGLLVSSLMLALACSSKFFMVLLGIILLALYGITILEAWD